MDRISSGLVLTRKPEERVFVVVTHPDGTQSTIIIQLVECNMRKAKMLFSANKENVQIDREEIYLKRKENE